jgi:predicted ATPase
MQERARGIACAQPQIATRTNMHLICALSSASARDVESTRMNAESLAELAARHRFASYGAYAANLLAWVALESGQPAEVAVAAFERAVPRLAANGVSRVYGLLLRSGHARALGAAGRHEEALRTIEQAIRDSNEMAQGWCDAELWRVRGELLLAGSPHDEAQASHCFERALTIARRRSARLWELRAAVSLARLWADQGALARAAGLLAPIHDWFTEGFDTRDLVEASALLGRLREPTSR